MTPLNKPLLITGPCAAESERQLQTTAEQLHKEMTLLGFPVAYFRAGVWKPRSSPNDFKGVGAQALKWLMQTCAPLALSPCVEVATPQHVQECEKVGIKAVWIGARTTVNPFMVQQLADALTGTDFTVMVKNPMVPDLKLWMGAIERMQSVGIKDVMAIHRGFTERSENILRNTPMWEIPIELKVTFPEIPIICDISHIAGRRDLLNAIAQEALTYGFDGLMVETHCQPDQALSDAQQQITPQELARLLGSLDYKIQELDYPNALLIKERAHIMNIDHQIAQLFKKRMMLVDHIAALKKEHHLPLLQPHQWQKIADIYLSDALQDDNYQNFINNFLEMMHSCSLERQKPK